ncbi:MAG: 16S rRNA (uracil(1498)-N(3))-methyltransferase [Caldimonas sp.]
MAFASGAVVDLPSTAARHVQVLRLQPGATIVLFNGRDGLEWPAAITRIGRASVDVQVGDPVPLDRELPCAVTLALGVPANDRMDALVEKAGELGAAAIQPLLCERSVLRLAGERAEAKRRHWRGVAAAASEQCGRARVADILPMLGLAAWLDRTTRAEHGASAPVRRVVLSLDAAAAAPTEALAEVLAAPVGVRASMVVLSGPEGGLTHDEERAAVAAGFVRVGLGPRVLRADTAPLALLAWLGLHFAGGGR